MDDLKFYVLFNSISVISGRLADDNERLCAMEPRLRLRRFCPEQGSNPQPLEGEGLGILLALYNAVDIVCPVELV